jgi:hypothetical protein
MLISRQQVLQDATMASFNSMFSWGKRRPESRSLLPPKDKRALANKEQPWEQISSGNGHPASSFDQHTDSTEETPCWPSLFSWAAAAVSSSYPCKKKPKLSSSQGCCNKHQRPPSKVHPLSSRIIRERNSNPAARRSPEDSGGTATEEATAPPFSSWGPFSSMGFGCIRMPLSVARRRSPEARERRRSRQTSPKKLGIGLSVLGIWPAASKSATFVENLKSIIVTPTSWKWFYSSDSILDNVLAEAARLKHHHHHKGEESSSSSEVEKKKNEYRKLLLHSPLTYNRLRRYPKTVLKVFAFLLRDKDPPAHTRKRMLIALCTTWCCKNKNYFCSLERSRPSVRKHGSTTSGDDNEQGGGGSGTLIVGGGGEATGRRSSCSSSKFSKRLLHTDTRNYKESAKGSADETKSEDTEAFRSEEQEQLVSGEGEEVESMCTEDDAESSRAFQDAEPSYCPCFACSSDDNFCYGCTCNVCKEMEQPGESFHCLKCKECGHIAHLKCAVKTGLAGCVPDRGLDSEYWCQSCGAKEDLVPYWKVRLREACQSKEKVTLEQQLYCAMLALEDTQRTKYKDLQVLVTEAWCQIANGGRLADVQSLVGLICSDIDSGSGVHNNPVDGACLQEHAAICLKKAEADVADVNETLQEVEAWKAMFFQTEQQLKRLELKLEVKTKSALLSRAAAVIARKRLQQSHEHISNIQPPFMTITSGEANS